MKNLKKIACVALSAAMIMSLAACGSSSKKATSIEEVSADDVKAAFEKIDLEELTWDDYWWENGTFYIGDDGDKAGGTGADGNDYNWKLYDSAEDARSAYDTTISYMSSMADEFDPETADEDDYAYFIVSYDGEAFAYYTAGCIVLDVTVQDGGMDEANEFLSALGYPEI